MSGGTLLQVQVYRGEAHLGTRVFSQRRVIVGRTGRRADLVLDSNDVSRAHAVFEHDGALVRVRDNGSTNGVFVNGRKVAEAVVGSLDAVVIAEFTLRLELVTEGRDPSNAPTRTMLRLPSLATDESTIERPGLAPAEALPAARRWEESEADDEEPRSYFALAGQLARQVRLGEDARELGLQILILHGDSVSAATILGPGRAYFRRNAAGGFWARFLGAEPPFIEHLYGGEAIVELPPGTRGRIMRGKTVLELEKAERAGRGLERASLKRGDVLDVTIGPHRYHAQFVSRPELPEARRSVQQWLALLDRRRDLAMLGSVALHAAFIVFGALPALHAVAPLADAESYAEVVLDRRLELEPPRAPPELELAKLPPPRPAKPKPAPRQKPKPAGEAVQPPGVLGIAEKPGLAAAPGPDAERSAGSSLTVDRAPQKGQEFLVAGLVSMLPTATIADSGSAGVVSKAGPAMLRGGAAVTKLPAGTARRAPTPPEPPARAARRREAAARLFGALVQKMPSSMVAHGSSIDLYCPPGQLDEGCGKDVIQKLINEKTSHIQRCYEVELEKNPKLAGKVEVQWTITRSGEVTGVRKKHSTLPSATAVQCILEQVRTWRFPVRDGREVVVSYPFVFKNIVF